MTATRSDAFAETLLPPLHAPTSLRVLVFEDNAMDAALIKRFLRGVGVPATQIYHADTIPTALQVLTRDHVDLCITDYYLRPHTGFDLMDEARRCHVDIPFIVVTALDDRSIDEGALAHGAYSFLIKGELTIEGLERSIRYALSQHRRESKLARAAYVDALTGLPNRAAFMKSITRAVTDNAGSGGMIGVALFNLNGTKFVNEAFSMSAGDEVLRTAGARLNAAREQAHVVARMGGDEFAVLMTGFLLANQALTAARQLVDFLTGSVETSGGDHVITAACGVATQAMKTGGATPAVALETSERLLQQAAQAMFTAKQMARMNGRSHVAIAHVH